MAFLGTFGTFSILILFYILAKLSERFGAVTRMRPLYRYYYFCVGAAAISFLAHLCIAWASIFPGTAPAWLSAPWFLLVAYYLPLTTGVTLGLIVTWRYWSWLITERNG